MHFHLSQLTKPHDTSCLAFTVTVCLKIKAFFWLCRLWRQMFLGHNASKDGFFCHDALMRVSFGICMLYVSGKRKCLEMLIQFPSCWHIQTGPNPVHNFKTFIPFLCDCCQSLFLHCSFFLSFPTSRNQWLFLLVAAKKERNRLELHSREHVDDEKSEGWRKTQEFCYLSWGSKQPLLWTQTHTLKTKTTCVHTYCMHTLPLINTHFCSNPHHPRQLAMSFILCVQ